MSNERIVASFRASTDHREVAGVSQQPAKDRSGIIADALSEFIQLVLQRVHPWVSRSGIDAGSVWAAKLRSELKETGFGIFCVNAENQHSDWMLFEAGAISKGLEENRVCALLFDMDPGDVTGPLAQFDHLACTQVGIRKLFAQLNDALEPKLSDKVLEKAFSAHWPDFEKAITSAREMGAATKAGRRSADDILSEVLDLARANSKEIQSIREERNRDRLSNLFNEYSSRARHQNSDWFVHYALNNSPTVRKILFDTIQQKESNPDDSLEASIDHEQTPNPKTD